ncbi:Acetyltransf_1 domain-containing protein [Cephalotus follicularis]|uniref:Acetyltransf_1 domain-containing protein n=1 Tax=Cephalotus follicularis TaxID=3775 RepID=A0A1Q3C541_CEPFO|nr:Acetyltransf_1 domain-containing protein [Cephalotus follicularis]
MGFVGMGAIAAPQIQIVSGGGGGYPLKSMELRWVYKRKGNKNPDESNKLKPRILPIYISTKSSDTISKAQELRELFNACNHSCHRLPKMDKLGRIEDTVVDIHKLHIALSHSFVTVSVFCNPTQYLNFIDTEKKVETLSVRNLFDNLVPVSVTPSNGKLVGFGRAVSDIGLTASIYDVMVIPSLRGMGIGRMIVKRIIRLLTSKDVYDIAAVCSENERLFFKACEFGDDILGSTTMMYTRTVSTYSES